MKITFRNLLTALLVTIGIPASHAQTPDWIKGYPLYEVWIRSASPEGTFSGFEARLGTIRELGINNLWLMPIYPIGVEGRKGAFGSPYSVRDYFTPNPEFGDSNSFSKLVKSVHAEKMRIILDWVPNHSSNDHILMKVHPDWWMHDSTGKFSRKVADWSDVTDWEYKNPAMRKYMQDALKKWLVGYGVDGFRFDVAGMVPTDFWKESLTELRSLRPDAFFLAEAYGEEFVKLGFNSKYDWPLYHALKAQVAGKIGADSLRKYISNFHQHTPEDFFILRFLENHDEMRATEAFGMDKLPAYIGLIFGLPGVPLLYNGQEIGTKHKPSIFEKDPIQWEYVQILLYNNYHKWIYWRHNLQSLRTGKLTFLSTPGNETKALAFARTSNQETSIVISNLSNDTLKITIPETIPGVRKATELKEALESELVGIDWKGNVTVTMLPWQSRLFVAGK